MALNQLGLGFMFTAQDRASSTIQRVGNTFDREGTRVRMSSELMQGAIVGLGASFATMAAGAATLRGAFNLAREAGGMEQGLARVQAITRATSEDLGRLRDRAVQAGIETRFSPTEAVEGLTELGVRGFQAQESMDALGGVLDFAAGGQVSVAEGAQSVGSALRVFALDAGQATLAADRLLRISNLTSLQANELSLALGTVSRGAGLTEQNMNEMLISMGLVRNTGVEASVAASSVSSALIFMTRNADEIRESLGVNVTETLEDGTTRMRDFADVILEASAAAGERFPDAAQRGAKMSELFGRFGLTAAQAIGSQLASGVRNAEGEIVRGAEALAYMREQMANAAGTAAEFRNRMLDTFEGQLTLLQGTVQTLRIVLGESLAVAIRPFVTALTDTLNFFIRVVEAIPGPVKRVIGPLIIGIGALITAFGALGVAGFAFALIIPFLKVIAITMAIVLAATLPVVVAVGALVAAVVAFGLAYRRNLGGMADFFQRVWGQITLGYRALTELFTRGGFTKAISEDLRRAENRGLRRFVINVFAIWTRLRRVFRGVREGFREMFQSSGPVVEALMQSIREFARLFTPVGDRINKVSRGPMERFRAIGVSIGKFVGRSLNFIIDVVRNLIQFSTGLVRRWREWGPTINRSFGRVRESFVQLWGALRRIAALWADIGETGRNGQQGAAAMGSTFMDVLIPALLYAARVLEVVVWLAAKGGNAFVTLVRTLRRVASTITSLVNRIKVTFHNMRRAIIDTFDAIASRALRVYRLIPAPLRSGLGMSAIGNVLESRSEAREGRQQADISKAARVATVAGRVKNQPGAEEFRQTILATRAARPGILSEERAAEVFRDTVRPIMAFFERPITVQIDGETIATATRAGARSASAGEFAPVGVGE